jgi:hypothetical protein
MYDKIGDLMYQVENLEATITYCRDHNPVLQGYPAGSLKDEFFKRVAEHAEEFKTDKLALREGQMDTAFNAFYVIDRFDQRRASVPTVAGVTHGSHVINFFVRPGREPVQQAGTDARAIAT